MSVDLKQFSELKDYLDKAQQLANQAEGALKELKRQLKERFKCSSLKEAKSKLKQLQQEEEKLSKKLVQLVEAYTKNPAMSTQASSHIRKLITAIEQQ